MTADLPTVPDELFTAAVRAFYARRFPDGDHADFLMLRLDSELYAEDFRAALAVAFAAGQAAKYAELTTCTADGWFGPTSNLQYYRCTAKHGFGLYGRHDYKLADADGEVA